MDVREKLVELIGSIEYGNGSLVGKNFQKGFIEKIASNLIAHGVTVIPPEGIGEMSDGYHTFNELYHHRAVLFSVICNAMPDKAWKSKRHDTGDMYDGMFIVGIETNHGQATYHYDVDPYWDMFNVPELEYAPKWDGHTPQEAINRIANGVTVQEWIPVSEPPKEKGTYIVCTDKGGVLLGHWYGKEWNVGGGAKKHLAYWMKKPKPPKGE